MSGDCALQERERVSSSLVDHKSQLFHQHSSSSSSLFSNIFLFDQKKGRKENSSSSSPLFQTTFCLSGRGEESILLYSNINLFYQNSSSSSLFQITLYLSWRKEEWWTTKQCCFINTAAAVLSFRWLSTVSIQNSKTMLFYQQSSSSLIFEMSK